MSRLALAWRGEAASNPDEGAAWTGDLNGVWQVHRHPDFRWLVASVERHVRAFCERLGFDLKAVALQFQRSWPVVSEPGQAVGAHHHPNAHVSCVYYLNGDGSGRAGVLRLYPPHHANELVPGMAVGYGGPIDPGSSFNRPWVDIAPRAGLLVIFPAHVDHAVTENESDDLRLSISFDIHLSAREKDASDPTEYLAPDPHQWDPFGPVPARARSSPRRKR